MDTFWSSRAHLGTPDSGFGHRQGCTAIRRDELQVAWLSGSFLRNDLLYLLFLSHLLKENLDPLILSSFA